MGPGEVKFGILTPKSCGIGSWNSRLLVSWGSKGWDSVPLGPGKLERNPRSSGSGNSEFEPLITLEGSSSYYWLLVHGDLKAECRFLFSGEVKLRFLRLVSYVVNV